MAMYVVRCHRRLKKISPPADADVHIDTTNSDYLNISHADMYYKGIAKGPCVLNE
jgi:hypothetical protein